MMSGAAVRVGVPQALLYHEYGPLFSGFLRGLGLEVVVSDPTSKTILDDGVKSAVDEACLPVKIFYGHVIDLCRKGVDVIFLPRIVSVERRAFTCPKLLGLPDMVRDNLKPLPDLVDTTVNLSRKPRTLYSALWQAASPFTRNPARIALAWRQGLRAQAAHEAELRAGRLPGLRGSTSASELSGPVQTERPLSVAVLGHSYNVYDRFVSLDTVARLRASGVRVVTADMVDPRAARAETERMPKELFWTMGRKILGAAYHFLRSGTVDGLVHLVSFGCGPDSLVGELVQHRAARLRTVPFLLLTLDEHSGEAGLVTRLEAFMDMVRRRRTVAGP